MNIFSNNCIGIYWGMLRDYKFHTKMCTLILSVNEDKTCCVAQHYPHTQNLYILRVSNKKNHIINAVTSKKGKNIIGDVSFAENTILIILKHNIIIIIFHTTVYPHFTFNFVCNLLKENLTAIRYPIIWHMVNLIERGFIIIVPIYSPDDHITIITMIII